MARNVQCQLYLGPYHLTQAAPGPLAVDYTALGLYPGQLPSLEHRIRARVAGAAPIGVNIILVPNGAAPHTTATIQTVPALEVGGEMDVDVYATYGMDRAQETD
jgi:hypothetical protein